MAWLDPQDALGVDWHGSAPFRDFIPSSPHNFWSLAGLRAGGAWASRMPMPPALIQALSPESNGGGGGRSDFAQAGGLEINKIDEAFKKIKSLI